MCQQRLKRVQICVQDMHNHTGTSPVDAVGLEWKGIQGVALPQHMLCRCEGQPYDGLDTAPYDVYFVKQYTQVVQRQKLWQAGGEG